MATIDLSALSSLDRDRAASTLPAGHLVRISRRPSAYADSMALQEAAVKALEWRRASLWRTEQTAWIRFHPKR